ncbi:MAG: PDDEXK nuclease domain-containing protein [Prevotellaceae bacterium]|jgi:predicted nuclease of restriction endonuclease-like (RecB) superfamily|nr:PDDEXK nuclease domain-containing protein [Prevotellaceae bacterium]
MSEKPVNYKLAVQAIKSAILSSQYEAAKSVNREQLSLYYGIGRYVSLNSRERDWGTGAIEAISEQLQKELPGLRGFSVRNIKNMRTFYEEWSLFLNRQPLAADLRASKNQVDIDYSSLLTINRQPMAADLSIDEFLGISFSHHIEIITKVKTIDERIFYIHQAFINRWSKYMLRDRLRAGDFHHQGQMPNNFAQTLPDSRDALKAIAMFKDEYLLDFINVEPLGERDKDIDERIVENGIVSNIKQFIMTFGQDFSFIGNQYRLETHGHEMFIDLLFFNRELNALVAVELKAGAFKPVYLGQLNIYLQTLDDFVRKPHENPSIGIVLCKDADKSFVEYAVRDYTKPMGVATYHTKEDMPERFRKALPDVDELKKLL